MGLDPIQRRTEHHRVRFADHVGLPLSGLADQGGDGPGGRHDALGGGARGVGVGRDETGALGDQPDRPRNGLEGIGAGFPQHHEIGVTVREDETGVVQCRGQSRLADDEGLAPR